MFTLTGEGTTTWNGVDRFHYCYRQESGDLEIVARLSSETMASPRAKAGVMIRNALNTDDAYAAMTFVRTEFHQAYWRPNDTDTTSLRTASGFTAVPYWFRVSRNLGTITCAISPDGTSWTDVETPTVSLNNTVNVGMYVASYETGTLRTAVFNNVSVTPAPAAFNLLSPANAATNVATDVTLDWEDATGATSYRVRVDDNSDFSNPVIDQASLSSSQYPVTAGTLVANTAYYWRVEAYAGTLPLITRATNNDFSFTTEPESRVTDGLIVLYEFEETSGATIYDTSGNGTPMDLTIQNMGAVTHATDTLTVSGNTTIESTSSKVIDACMLTNEITIEAWIVPANTTQGGPARIVTQSAGSLLRDYSLCQQADTYVARLRTTATGDNGTPDLVTPASAVTTALTHLVFTRAAGGTWHLYINGTSVATGSRTGDFSNWDTTHDFALCGEYTDPRYWQGILHLVAIYNKALSQIEVIQNNDAGPDPDGVTAPPGAFALSSPADGATSVALTATLDWTDASGATTYAVLIDDNSDFSSPVVDEPALVASSYTLIPGDVLDSTMYYWRVTATNANGSTPAANNDYTFTTVVPPLPGPFALSTPLNDANPVSLTATLDWDDSSDATMYTLLVADNPSFVSPVISQSALPLSEYTLLDGELEGSTTYYWQVTAFNGTGSTPASNNSFRFTTDVEPPPLAFSLLSPTDAATDVRVGVTFDWEDAIYADTYRLLVDDDPLFASPEIDEALLATSTFTATDQLEPEVTYYWRVTATNLSGITVANADFSFTTVLPMGYIGDGCTPRRSGLGANAVAALLLACLVAVGVLAKR
jgi:hypothetical protein